MGNFFKSANQPGWEEVSQIASEGGSHELRYLSISSRLYPAFMVYSLSIIYYKIL